MAQRNWYGRDVKLQLRMLLTILLLILTFLVFGGVIFAFTKAYIFLIVIPIVGLVVQYFASDKLVLAASGARIVTPAQAPQLHAMVERLAQLADLPKPQVAIMDNLMPNAFATGRNPKHAVVAVTTGLLNRLSPQELEAVLGHEMTHIRNRDMTVMTMASSILAVASFLTQILMWTGMWGGMGGGFGRRDDRNGAGAYGLLIVLAVSALTWFVSYVLINALSRYREYAADRGSAILTGAPEQLISALTRITSDMARVPSQDLRQAQPMSALYIASPKREIISEFFADHPSLQHRIARLQALQLQMSRAS
ncbi:MAG TPA: zinc metalloprotease HtpX [Chloroflexota bacterium]|nr:zinc metalloprotease HtpX [Chloroflexota bacterium]